MPPDRAWSRTKPGATEPLLCEAEFRMPEPAGKLDESLEPAPKSPTHTHLVSIPSLALCAHAEP